MYIKAFKSSKKIVRECLNLKKNVKQNIIPIKNQS